LAVTIGEVAAAAGVSTSTVSRCFATPDLVRADTRTRVLAVAANLGYTPNRIARSLAVGRTRSIALIVPDIANLFFGRIVKAAQSRARAKDYAVFLADTDERARDEYELAVAMAKQVDGLLLASPRMSEQQLRDIAERTPTVLVNRPLPGRSSVLVPSTEGMWQAVQHLYALGHRHVAHIPGARGSWSSEQRTLAVRGACEEFGVELTEFAPCEPFFRAGVRAADLLIASGASAVIAHNDIVALGAVSRLSERRVSVPGDISVVGSDDTLLARAASPPLTSVRIPLEEVGTRAADLLLDLLAHGDGPPPVEEIRVETELIVRGSTGPLRKDPAGRSAT
jgi:DNA-binding LacI/PurR family transcriptional regulator